MISFPSAGDVNFNLLPWLLKGSNRTEFQVYIHDLSLQTSKWSLGDPGLVLWYALSFPPVNRLCVKEIAGSSPFVCLLSDVQSDQFPYMQRPRDHRGHPLLFQCRFHGNSDTTGSFLRPRCCASRWRETVGGSMGPDRQRGGVGGFCIHYDVS